MKAVTARDNKDLVSRLVKNRVHNDPSLNNYSFWLDDFGSGYAGFSALYNSRFRFVKLDRQLLWDFMKKPGGEGLMRALLRFFHLNHYRVIIEGVETHEQKKWLDENALLCTAGEVVAGIQHQRFKSAACC